MAEISTEQVLDELRRGLRAYKAFEHAEEVISRLAGLEQNEREIRASIDVLKAEKESADRELEKTRAKAEEVAADAIAKADKAIADANSQAASVVAAANAEAASIRDDANSAKASADEHAAAMKAEADAAELRRDKAVLAAEEAEKRLADANAEIARILGRA